MLRATALKFGATLAALAVATFVTFAQDAPPARLLHPPKLIRSGHVDALSTKPLEKFYRRLEQLRAGKIARITVLQIGDSHTEADHFSGRLRMLLQARFGDAGRGMLPPGSPFPYWRPYQVQARQSGSWSIFSSNTRDRAPLPFGLTGIIARNRTPDDMMTLEVANENSPFDVVEIGYYRKPGGGMIAVSVDNMLIGEIDTRGELLTLDRRVFTLSSPGRRLEVRPQGNDSVDVADWTIYRTNPGVVLTNQGFSGAQAGIMEKWDWPTVKAQLRALDPSLILLAFGTNEGYAAKSRLQSYQALLEARVRAFQEAAPDAAIVLIAGPDANDLPIFCNKTPLQRSRADCRPLSPSEIVNYDAMLARSDPRLCRWHTPGSYPIVRAAQRAVAQQTGTLFWDWFDAQGGMCGASKWAQNGLVLPDRVHMTKQGYWLSADQFYAVLMRGYQRQ